MVPASERRHPRCPSLGGVTQDLTIRQLSSADEPLLVEATLGNLNWQTIRFTEQDVRARPEFRHYTQLVPARGDFGLVAERIGDPVAVGWAQLLPADDPGYGFVDEVTPEVSLWVREDQRGMGVGRRLLGQLQQEARERGLSRLSLSVESGNHARALYASVGFTGVPGREANGVMVWSP